MVQETDSLKVLGIATAHYGNELEIFVSDDQYDRVQVFGEKGNFKRKFSLVNGDPRGIAVDDNGSVYVADRADRVNVYDRNGTFLRSISGIPGDPWGLSIQGNRLAVGNSGAHYVRIYDVNGTFIKQFGTYGKGVGEFDQPRGVSFAPNGDLWVADRVNHRCKYLTAMAPTFAKSGICRKIPVFTGLKQWPRI